MSIIPQDPFLFDDSVHQNLDPKGNYATFEIADVLAKCHLTKAVQDLGEISLMRILVIVFLEHYCH